MVQVRDDPIIRAIESRGYGPRYLTEEGSYQENGAEETDEGG
ncbi:MAG: hypothetical protein ACI4O0_07970 [Candidatus Limivicinus sp.]